MKIVSRNNVLAIVGAFALTFLVACGGGQSGPESQAAPEAGSAASSSAGTSQGESVSSEAQPAAPSKADFAVEGDGWGFVYPECWKGKVDCEVGESPYPSDKTAKDWNIKTATDDAHIVMAIAEVSKETGEKYLAGGEDDVSDTLGRATLGSGQAATIRTAKTGVLALVVELPNGRWLLLWGTDKIPSSPSESQKKELDARCDLQSFGKKSSWEDYDEALVTSFLEQIAGYVYATSK